MGRDTGPLKSEDGPAMEDAQNADRPLLFRPITLRSITARNRIVVSPMCQYLSVDGGPTDWHLVHLGRFAMGGAGIVFCEDTAVEDRGRSTYDCAGIYDDRFIPQYRRIVEFIKAMGAVPAIQIGHTGRRAATKGPMDGFAPLTTEDAARGRAPWRPVSPSESAPEPGGPTPLVLDRDEIRKIVAAFGLATRRAVAAGYEICEIHGAHGYLLHQFLSPASNCRTDGYGGDLAGRMRFALEVVETVRAAWPTENPLFFRVSAVDGKGGTWGMRDTLALVRALRDRGVDVIDCSSGGITGDSALPAVPRVPGFQVEYARRVRLEVEIKTIAVGLITEARQAETILQDGAADLVALASEMMYDPNWPVHAARALDLPDYLDLLPHHHAFRLKRRQDMLATYPPGQPVVIPYEVDEAYEHHWS
jgi:2,4-dienoyl-CoA reductase-like NADH-dependent reductase (Old Yellow Enzyme family)